MIPEKPDRRGTPPGAGIVPGKPLYPGANPGRIGNPPFQPTQEQRELVKTYAKVMTQEMIASALDISVDTLTRYFRKEYEQGKRDAVAAVGGKLLAKALAGDKTCMIFYLRTQGKWSQRVEVTGADGGPVQHLDLTRVLETYSEEQLAILEPLLEQLLAAGGADFDFRDQIGAPASEDGSPA